MNQSILFITAHSMFLGESGLRAKCGIGVRVMGKTWHWGQGLGQNVALGSGLGAKRDIGVRVNGNMGHWGQG